MSGLDLFRDQEQTNLPELAKWVSEIAELTKPDAIVWCDGSQAEWERLITVSASAIVSILTGRPPASPGS